MQEVKENKKVLYHFAIFTIVNELLIIKNRISLVYCLMQARDEIGSRLLDARGVVYYKRQWLRTSDV